MSNKVILLSMAGLLLGGLFAVLVVIRSAGDEKVDELIQLPVSEVELVTQLLNTARAREDAARAVRERGVALRPVREYAAAIEGREAERRQKLETWPNANNEFKTSIDWWGLPEAELASAYIHFEQEQNQYLRQILMEARLLKSEFDQDLARQWAGEAVADEAKLQELAGLLPAI